MLACLCRGRGDEVISQPSHDEVAVDRVAHSRVRPQVLHPSRAEKAAGVKATMARLMRVCLVVIATGIRHQVCTLRLVLGRVRERNVQRHRVSKNLATNDTRTPATGL